MISKVYFHTSPYFVVFLITFLCERAANSWLDELVFWLIALLFKEMDFYYNLEETFFRWSTKNISHCSFALNICTLPSPVENNCVVSFYQGDYKWNLLPVWKPLCGGHVPYLLVFVSCMLIPVQCKWKPYLIIYWNSAFQSTQYLLGSN